MAKQLPENLAEPISRYLAGKATPEDKEQINLWYISFDDSDVVVHAGNESAMDETDARIRMRLAEIMELSKDQKIIMHPQRRSLLPRIAAAAAVIFILSSSAWFFITRKSETVDLVKLPKKHYSHIINAESKAVLTLQDGSKISLTDSRAGQIAREEGFTITKMANGELVYSMRSSGSAGSVSSGYNQIEVPKGTQYKLRLPDGTKVLLNSGSIFRFPSNFRDAHFDTQLQGEGYFEVAHNKLRKFKVRSGHQLVEVLGTRFNINAYKDEPSITTLLEGSILITDLNTSVSKLIKPGQQATLERSIMLSEVNAADAKAWAEGYFHFNDADLKNVMHQLERWYGISVKYEGSIQLQQFSGVIDKHLTLEQVLEILEKNDVHFKVNGQNVTVTP